MDFSELLDFSNISVNYWISQIYFLWISSRFRGFLWISVGFLETCTGFLGGCWPLGFVTSCFGHFWMGVAGVVTIAIDNRVGEGLETVWASNNFTRIFNGERCCKMTKPARRTYGKL